VHHGDLGVGIVLEAVEASTMLGDREVDFRQAVAARVLVPTAFDGGDRGTLEKVGAVEIREALTQVDRVVTQGERGHLREDRGAEALQLGRQMGEPRAAHAPECRTSARVPNDTRAAARRVLFQRTDRRPIVA
jgi:hypothetical protein